MSEGRTKEKEKQQHYAFLSQDSEKKKANSTEPHALLDYARDQEFWEGNVHCLIKGIIIPPIALAQLRVNPPY